MKSTGTGHFSNAANRGEYKLWVRFLNGRTHAYFSHRYKPGKKRGVSPEAQKRELDNLAKEYAEGTRGYQAQRMQLYHQGRMVERWEWDERQGCPTPVASDVFVKYQ